MTQKELTPEWYASSTETRVEVAPIQDAARVKYTNEAGRLREARKKSSMLLTRFEKIKLAKRIREKYPSRTTRYVTFTQHL